MTAPTVVEVELGAPVDAAYAYLSDPRNRPAWQSSLRRVEDVSGAGGAGTTWTDVTVVGARPRMRVTEADPGRAWAETGRWRGVEADLRLHFVPTGTGSRVVATFGVRTPPALAPVGRALRRLAAVGIRSDLRRAGRALGS